MRSLPPEQRFNAALSDPAILEAVIAAPAGLSGLPIERHKALADDALKERYGEQLAEVSEVEEVYTTASSALGMAGGDLFKASGMRKEHFDELLGGLERSVDSRRRAA